MNGRNKYLISYFKNSYYFNFFIIININKKIIYFVKIKFYYFILNLFFQLANNYLKKHSKLIYYLKYLSRFQIKTKYFKPNIKLDEIHSFQISEELKISGLIRFNPVTGLSTIINI